MACDVLKRLRVGKIVELLLGGGGLAHGCEDVFGQGGKMQKEIRPGLIHHELGSIQVVKRCLEFRRRRAGLEKPDAGGEFLESGPLVADGRAVRGLFRGELACAQLALEVEGPLAQIGQALCFVPACVVELFGLGERPLEGVDCRPLFAHIPALRFICRDVARPDVTLMCCLCV